MKCRSIVLVDFSEGSASALKFAQNWSLNNGAEMLVIHQTNTETPSFVSAESGKELIDAEANNAKKKMNAFLDKHLAKSKKPSVIITHNTLVNQINELNKSTDYQNVVFLGLKGTGKLKRLFIGSEAIKVIENVDVPVLAIPSNISNLNVNKLSIGVSEDFKLNLLSLSNFLKLCNNNNLELHFFNLSKSSKVTTETERLFSDLKVMFGDDYKTSTNVYHFEGDKISGIKALLEESDDEILVIQKGSRYFSDYVFRKFVINELVYDGKTSLLVLP